MCVALCFTKSCDIDMGFGFVDPNKRIHQKNAHTGPMEKRSQARGSQTTQKRREGHDKPRGQTQSPSTQDKKGFQLSGAELRKEIESYTCIERGRDGERFDMFNGFV